MNRSTRRGLLTAIITAASMHVIVGAQGAGQNINVVTGSGDQFTGDMFRQRQNEGVVGISSVNPANMMIAYNDYRTVDIADDLGVGTISPAQGFVATLMNFLRAPWRLGRDGAPAKEIKTAANAWIGLSFSNNGGKNFYSGLHPGRYTPVPPDTDPALPDATRLQFFDAASDAVMATTPNQFFLGGIAFNPPGPGSDGKSVGFVSRFTDLNNSEQGQTIHFDGTKILLETTSAAKFVDKPSIAAGANGHVYAAFVVFDQLDPTKLSSNILFFSSANYGQTWAPPVVVSQPLTRNQSPWILVDPTNENIVYIGWRVFAAQAGGWTNAIVGRKSTNGGASFTPSIPYPVALLLKAFDQPQGNLSGPSPTAPSPRSNAYPTAAIDGKGAIHVAMQEYVYPANYPTALLRGRPLSPTHSPSIGVPRITVTTSYDGGATWTLRKAVDLGTAAMPAGTQFMPVLAAAGEPGPSCSGSSGPRSRVMLMYYDARAGGVGLASGGTGYLMGGDKQFDVRIAQASACSTTGLTFSPSEQVSQYTRSADAPFNIVKSAGSNYAAVNRAYPMFCGGNCAFSGDYMHLSPRVPYFQTMFGEWKPTTAVTDPADRGRLPAPVVQAVWADTRDAVLPSTGGLRVVPPTASPLFDALPWDVYQPPGTGLAPCVNPGSRDQNLYTAEYTPGGLYASAPTTFRTSAIPRSYPLYVENRTPQRRYYRVTIDPLANASFDFTDFDGGPPQHQNFGEPYARVTNLVVGPISSVTGTVVVGPGVTQPILIKVEETTAPVGNEGGAVIAPPLGAVTSVRLLAGGADTSTSETYQPAVHATPIVTKPFAGLIPVGGLQLPAAPAAIPSPTPFSPNPVEPTPFSPNPFSPNPFSPNPFSPNPFSPNPFSPNPFSPNPFSPNPFSVNVTVYDVTDISYVVRNQGEQTAAFNALASVQTAPGTHAFQLLINRAVPTPILIRDAFGKCRAADSWQPVLISTIANPFSPNPFSPNPFSPNPFSPNPFSPNPFSPNPFPLEFSNATFYVKPADTTPTINQYVAPPSEDVMVITIRDFVLVPFNPADPATHPITPAAVTIKIAGQVSEQKVGGGFVGTPPVAGTQVPHSLAFIVQPTNTSAGAPITPAVKVAVRDAFGATVTTGPGATALVTIAIGTNPALGALSGTLTRNAVGGIATFDNLAINTAGVGYTLVASSGSLLLATSQPFTVIPLVLLDATLFDGIVGSPYPPSPQALKVQGGQGPFTFALDPNAKVNKGLGPQPATLPPGLSLNASTGVISGSPTSAGEYAFRVIVTDTSSGVTAAANFCIHVSPNLAAALVTKDLTPAQGETPAALATNLLDPAEAGVAVSNAITTGAATAIGSFTGGGSASLGVGFHQGVLLSSGAIGGPFGAQGPNNSSSNTTAHNLTGDADLALLANTTLISVRDAAILEFNFTPTCASGTTCNVTFEYVFGSDEYHEFANSSFNDVFGFFLTDLTPGGTKKNYAILPGVVPETPVAINTVNGGNPLGTNAKNLAFFRSNRTLNDQAGPLNLQADGLTTPLQFNAPVVSGRPYRIKIGIADVGDSAYDSWVFIKSGSFKVTHICPIIVQ